LTYEPCPEEKSRIEQLIKFRDALSNWRTASMPERERFRSSINEIIFDVHETVQLAGFGITFTATPPPITGGPILRDLDPFDHLFNPPYGLSVIPGVIDAVERTMAKIRSGKFFVQGKSGGVATSRPEKAHPSNTRIFLVHGHDESARETVARFLEKLGLEVVTLSERPGSSDAMRFSPPRSSGVSKTTANATSEYLSSFSI
jgi:hypothetical protein